MNTKDQYGLEFLKVTAGENVGHQCIRKDGMVDENNLLQFLNYLNISRTEFLLKEINDYLNTTPDTAWMSYDSMVLEHIDLKMDYPEFIIDEQPNAFPLSDIRDLLKEWLMFLHS
ncbi:hypothetical protein B0A69_18145 [Chryseobacterium shigense]|uniref:Uncharacterized protein n=1 Tax=Chryseobacterium shigense TaxID=297244 RepID=A0A1N7K9K1_9FLAO|nr:hypothetical protein [Chryseobacterium shigense]PQA91177.1 hypothetical protein B0A69_18145 [Chryseobacterium shigense]SIS58212.1 hypothetical protein SAMN05421639_10918 [Chryseobacterium shigense]